MAVLRKMKRREFWRRLRAFKKPVLLRQTVEVIDQFRYVEFIVTDIKEIGGVHEVSA